MKIENKSTRNKRIAKNTLYLYLRMAFVTIVSFFTARITLQILGVEDFGIQNVVTSIVSFIGIFTGALTSATQRFFAFDLGKNDIVLFKKTFSSIFFLFLTITISLTFIAALIGPWCIQNYLTIPTQRLSAAVYTFYFSLISLAASMMLVPFSSAIIAYERMGAFARLSIFDACGKLVVIYLLYICNSDKLVTLAALNSFFQICLLAFYAIYCKTKLKGCKISFSHDKSLYKELTTYIGWNIFGYGAGMLCTIGINICLNVFFGPITNAAKGIADKINQLTSQLNVNFFMAFSPQIIKSYASQDMADAHMLVYKSSKYSFLLILFVALPLIIGMQDVLSIWLGQAYVTQDMILFCQWTLIFSLVNTLESPITTLIRATGDIKKYQITVGTTTILTVPICICLFIFGFPAIYSMIAWTLVYAITQYCRLVIAHKQVGISITKYNKNVIMPLLYVSLTSLITVKFANKLLVYDGLMHLICITLICFTITIITTYTIGLTNGERRKIKDKLQSLKHKTLKI